MLTFLLALFFALALLRGLAGLCSAVRRAWRALLGRSDGDGGDGGAAAPVHVSARILPWRAPVRDVVDVRARTVAEGDAPGRHGPADACGCGVSSEMQRWFALLQSGAITRAEFEGVKRALLRKLA